MKTIPKASNRIAALSLVAVLLLSVFAVVRQVEAASLSNTYLRLNRMDDSTTTSMRLVFSTTSAGATSVAINMNGSDASTWTGNSGVVNATQTVSSASCAAETGTTALPGTLSASGSSPTITITGVTALSATTNYCVDLTSATAVTTPTAAGEYHPLVTVGSDSITVAVRTVTNDQVVITATVPPSFNFVLSDNTDSFTTNLSTAAPVLTTGVTATVNTNAKTGWIAWAKDSNTGLTSALASKTIASTTPGTSATLSNGVEGYVVGVVSPITQGSGAGVTAASTAYNATAGAHGSGLDSTLRQIASSDGTASGASIVIKARASINSLTPAASDYTDTMTVIGAAKF